MTRIGVLALQGDVREHASVLTSLGAEPVQVRRLAELDSVDGIIIPGGESTTIDKLLRAFGLFDPLQRRIEEGLPVLGTCAGMVLLADRIEGAAEGQQTLGGIPMVVRRNAFGRQVDSSEVELVWQPDGSTMHATFIRAPWVQSAAPEVEVLATVTTDADHIVAVRHGSRIATAFHPEISGDPRVHQMLVDLAG